MDSETYLAHIRHDSDLLLAAGTTHIDDTIPTCPDWNGEQLIAHVAWVYRFAQHCLGLAEGETLNRKAIAASPSGEAVIADFTTSRDDLLEVLSSLDESRTAFTFVGPQPAGWWIRRQAQETAMHRWDAQSASPSTDPIDAALAVDGIDEAFEIMMPRRFDNEAFGASGESMHLHATDIDGEWMVDFTDDGPTWRHGHDKGTVAAKGSASDLLLFVYSRLPAARLEVFGEADILSRYQQAAAY